MRVAPRRRHAIWKKPWGQRAATEESALLLQSAEASYSQKLVEALEAEAQIESARAELLTHTAVTERLMEIGRQLEAALERLALQAEGLAREGERAAGIHAQAEAESAKLQEEIKTARARIDALLAEREHRTRELAVARAEVEETAAAHARTRDEAAR